MQAVTLGIYLYHTTHQAYLLGTVTLASWLPAIIGSPLGGVVAERWSRQRWIQINNFVMALSASTLTLLAFTHHLSPLAIISLALVEGFSSSSSWAAWQSLLPDLVAKDEVLAAVSLSSAQFNLGRVIGPSAATIAISFGSYGWSFACNAASFIFVFIIFFFVRTPSRALTKRPLTIISDVAVGARAAWRSDPCRHAIISVLTVAFILSPFIALIPAMAQGALHAGGGSTGLLTTAQGLGAVVAAFTLPSVAHRTSRLAVLRGSMMVLAVSVGLYGFAPSRWWSMAALFVVGGAYIGTLSGLNTSVQLHAPAAERSRILSLYTLALSIGYPIGAQIQGAIAGVVGVRQVTVATSIVGVVLLTGVLSWRPQFLRILGATPRAVEPAGA
jgi:MFS family permease